MSFCPKCGTQVQDGGKFCPACGSQVSVARAPATSSQDPYIGRKLDNKFLIEELLGVGGMGKVYKANQLSLDKIVCVKVLRQNMMDDETLVGRFHREARAASRLNHPNSITVIEFGQDPAEGALYMVMEFVPGKDLSRVIREDRPFSEKRIVVIIDQVLSALADAHAAGIVHRDLKPENIMVTELRGTKDFVKVLDFGIAKLQESSQPDPGLTQVGMVCGTPEYMSPEQAKGEELDARSDIYATGVILYQMVVGKIPFQAPTAMGIVTKHLIEPPVPPSQIDGVVISPAMEKVILKAMSKDRNGRQLTALALQQELNQVLSQKVAPAQEVPLGQDLFADEPAPQPGSTAQPDAAEESKATYVREPKAEPKGPTYAGVKSDPSPGGSKTWLWVILIILVLGGGGAAAAYFLWYLPNQEKETQDGGFEVVVDAGVEVAAPDAGVKVKVEEPKAAPVDAGVVAKPPEDAGTVAVVEDKGPAEQVFQADVPEMAKRFYQAGKELMVQNKLKKAIKVFGKAIKKFPGYAAAYKALGMCHMRLGNIVKAKKNFRSYLKKAPTAEDAADIKDLIESL
ncbi:MAG: protein kinase [Deltaproteobacteria bacterium]|nr:protein kinase [Deltaproteobacteria bacterium]